jgi:anaerobic selenocysteine-containing dehydrogenase
MTAEPTLVRGACPHDCPDTCATITEVRDGRAVAFYADKSHSYTQGWLCAKVRPYLERVYSPDRLRYPLRRVGPKGGDQWERISWDTALATIAERWRAIIAAHGAAAILPYSYSGTLGLIQMGICDERLWNRMGASGLDRTICCSASHVAVGATLGARHGPDPADVLKSRLVILWGNNPASSGPHFMPLLRQAQKAGAYVVVIDPRRTTSARSADEYIQIRPATDAALALGLMHVIFAEGLHDEPWLVAHSQGWRELRERATAFPPARVAAITGVHAETIIGLARRYAATKPALLKFADGLQRHASGGQAVRALCCLPALVGQYGVPGGGLSYSTSGYIAWDAETMGHAAACPPTPRSVNMNRIGAALLGEAADPPIMSLFVYGANPVASAPNVGLIVRGLMRDDLFTVVHEQFMTDTARYADIVLPATTQLEHADLHRAYGQRNLQYNHPAIAPLGECKSNWDTMRALAAAMGYAEPWLHESAEEAIAALVEASRPANPQLQGVTIERLREQGTVPLHFTEDDYTPFAGGKFPTPSGKIELLCPAMASHGVDPLPDYTQHSTLNTQHSTLTLISGASHHFVSSSFGNQPSLRAKEGSPFIEINPQDAAAYGIADGADVRVESERGWCRLRAVITTDVAPGVAVAPKGQWARLSPDGRNINWTTSDALADLGGGATFHGNQVSIRPA